MAHAKQGGLWTFIIDNSMLLIAGTLAGMLWANTAHASHEHFSHALHFVVNDIGMVFFFALATKEIVEATLAGRPALVAARGGRAAPCGRRRHGGPGGALHRPGDVG